MRDNTPPASPYTDADIVNEADEDDDNELIYIGEADEVIEELERQQREDEEDSNEDDGDEELMDGSTEQNDLPEIPEHDDAIITFKKHNSPVFCGSFHPSKNLIVTGGEDDTAYVWDLETGEIVFECLGHKDTVIGAEFSYDGNYLATGDMAGEIQLFSLSSNYERVWDFQMGDMSWMKWHPKINILLAGAESGEIYAWRLPTGECKVFNGHGKKSEIACFTADGKKLVAGYSDGAVKFWDFKTNTVEFEVDGKNPLGHTESITSLCTDRDNQMFMTGAEDGKILIGSRTGAVANLNCNGSSVEAVAICNESDSSLKLAATGTLDGKIIIWDISKQTVRAECIDPNPVGITTARWLPNFTLIVGTLDGTIKGFDGRTGQMKFTLQGHLAEIYDLKYHKESNLILSTSEDKTVQDCC